MYSTYVHVSAQSCLILCDPTDCSPPSSFVHGSVEFSRLEYWSWLPFPTPGDLPEPEIESESPMSPVLVSLYLCRLGNLYMCPHTHKSLFEKTDSILILSKKVKN